MTGIELIAKEREEQISVHGHTLEKDDQLTKGELLEFAKYLIFSNKDNEPPVRVWDRDFIYSFHFKTILQQLTVSGAFIAAELDRLLRIAKINKRGIDLIVQERKEQIEKHGWDHDNEYEAGELLRASFFCITLDNEYYPLNWSNWFAEKVIAKRLRMDFTSFRIEMLKIAGAFVVAEIDRRIFIKDNI